MAPPDQSAYTRREMAELHDAVFTVNPSGRDRIWHLSSVFNHSSPEVTLGDYVHFLDVLLYIHLSRSERRLPADVIASILQCPKKSFARSQHCESNEFLIAKALPIAWAHNKDLFQLLEVPTPIEEEVYTGTHEAPTKSMRQDLVALAQIVLEEIENGQDPDIVAIRYGADTPWVKTIHRTAIRLSKIKSRNGVPRLFSAKRRRAARRPIVPTRLSEAVDQELASKLIPALRNGYPSNETLLVDACKHWLAHTTSSNSKLRFHSPEKLQRFLRCFVETRVIPNQRWLIVVSPPATKSSEDLCKSWTVFPNVAVRIENKTVKKFKNYPRGIASLHLQKPRSTRLSASKDTSRLLRYVLHMLSILLDVDVDQRSETVTGSNNQPAEKR